VEVAHLRRAPLAVHADPWRAALALRGDEHAFALTGRWAAGGAVLGSEPVRVAHAAEDPFALLDEQPRVAGIDEDAGDGAVGGGWVGFLGYGLGGRLEPVGPQPPRPIELPDFALAFYDHVLRRDAAGRWWFEALWTPARDAALAARRAALEARLRALPDREAARAALGELRLRAPGAAGHVAAVAACRERIAAGDLFQANLCLRLETTWSGEPEALFARAGPVLTPDRAALLRGPWGALVSLSPELFLERRGRTVRTAPIKGTAPLGDAALDASGKDRAENVMIADLMRNHLGRVAAYGAVHVDAPATAADQAGVRHLVSGVRATLRDGAGDGDLVRATFPPGSVTGAPKVAAQGVIAELEATGREAYTGAIGFASPVAGLELGVTIRTFELCGERAWLGAGGGVTWGSDPEAELEECLVKARPLAAAAGTRLATPPPPGARPTTPALPHALALTGAPRPDPALGRYTTILVRHGAAVDLDAHLRRLGAAHLAGDVAAAARALAEGRVRVTLRAGLRPVVDAGPLPPFPPEPVALAPVLLPGGLGDRKWDDRRLLEALTARLHAMPLLVDLDGAVLETDRAAVMLLEGDALVGPPRDGRILDSTSRRLIEALAPGAGLEVRAEPLELTRARAADAIVVASALRGPRRATLDGARGGDVPALRTLKAAWASAVAGSARR